MKLYNRSAFLKLPEGIAYCKGEGSDFGGVCFKGDTVAGVDWYVIEPSGIDADDMDQEIDRLDEMRETGACFPIDLSECRDGFFDEDAIFLVLDERDLRQLRELIDRAIGVTKATRTADA